FIPEGVSSFVDGDIVNLKWKSAPNIKLEGFNVWYSKTSGSGFQKLNDKPVKATYASYRGLERNTTYYFRVTSVLKTIPPTESQPSVEVVAGTTNAPS